MTTTSDRVLGVLGLFTIERPEWTVEGAAAESGLFVSTAYRYFRSLAKAGLIAASASGRYVLGPAIIAYDRQLRLSDPLTNAAQPIMKRLAQQMPPNSMLLLCRLFRKQVMCVHQEACEHPHFVVSYERGRPMPLFRGASSQIILAHLPSRTVKRFHERHPLEFAAAGLGREWTEVKRKLRELRAAGISFRQGDIDQGLAGIAVPVFDQSKQVVGSLTLVIRVENRAPQIMPTTTSLLQAAGEEIWLALAAYAGRNNS